MKGHSTHHIWWPRRRFHGRPERRAIVRLSNRVHEAYHKFWFQNCRDFPERRGCFKHWCRYACICCYCQNHDTF